MKDVPVVQSSIQYTNQTIGKIYILIFNEALWMDNQPYESLTFEPKQTLTLCL